MEHSYVPPISCVSTLRVLHAFLWIVYCMKLLVLLLVCVTGGQLRAQTTFLEQFTRYAQSRDSAGQYNVLQQWRAQSPDDPELYVSCINYYVSIGRREITSIDAEPSSALSLRLEREGSDEVLYMNERLSYDKAALQQGLNCIDTGIVRFPNRLDMRFGKIYVLGEVENFRGFAAEIVAVVQQSARNGNQWLWKDGKAVADPKGFMLSTIQDYVNQLYNNDDNYAVHIRAIADAVLQYYPDHVESLANMALTYVTEEKYDEVLVYLLRAEKLAPTDVVVLNNIATCYDRQRKVEQAVTYYEKVEKYGGEYEKADAAANLQRLRKK